MNKQDSRYSRVVGRVIFDLDHKKAVRVNSAVARATDLLTTKEESVTAAKNKALHILGIRKWSVPDKLDAHLQSALVKAHTLYLKLHSGEKDKNSTTVTHGVRHQRNPKGKARKSVLQ